MLVTPFSVSLCRAEQIKSHHHGSPADRGAFGSVQPRRHRQQLGLGAAEWRGFQTNRSAGGTRLVPGAADRMRPLLRFIAARCVLGETVVVVLYGLGAAAAIGLAIVACLFPDITLVAVCLIVFAGLAISARRRNVADDRPHDPPGFAWELVLLPTLVSIRQSTTVLIIGLAIALIIAIFRRAPVRRPIAGTLPLTLLLLATIVSARTDLLIAGLVILVAIIAAVSSRKTDTSLALKSVSAGLVLYFAANIAAHFAGVQSPAAAVRLGGYTSSGIFGERILFPLSRSINETSIVAAIFLVIVATRWVLRYQRSNVNTLGVALALYVMYASNSRVPLVIAFALMAVVMIAPSVTRVALPIVVPIAMAFPFYLGWSTSALNLIAGAVNSVAYFSRGQSVEELVELGTRGPIWEGTLLFWTQYADTFNRLFGWGPNGHATSGANLFYLDGQDRFLANPIALTTHNSFLQTLLDGGLFSLATLIAGIVIILIRFGSAREFTPLALAVAAACLCGVMEVVIAPAATTTPFILVVVLSTWATGVPRSTPPQANRQRTPHRRRLAVSVSR